MKLVRGHKQTHQFATLIYIDKSNKLLDETILEIGKRTDIYIYIAKKSKIDPLRYSLLLPVTGYSHGSLTEVEAIVSLVKDLSDLPNGYEKLILINNLNTESYLSSLRFLTRYIDSYSTSSVLRLTKTASSLFSVRTKSYDELSKLYKKLYYLTENYKVRGAFTTYSSDDEFILLDSRTLDDLLEELQVGSDLLTKYFIDSFKSSKVGDFIPSLFDWMEYTFPEYNLKEIMRLI